MSMHLDYPIGSQHGMHAKRNIPSDLRLYLGCVSFHPREQYAGIKALYDLQCYQNLK